MKNTSERADSREHVSPLRQVLFPVCAISIISGLAIVATVRGFRTVHAERMRTEVARMADTNQDSISTHDEWATVYEGLGQPYRGMEGTDLSPDQLRYLSENSK
ncbi:MAG: hypothetical protein AABX12_00855 [Nanoarchaeota archaeon]